MPAQTRATMAAAAFAAVLALGGCASGGPGEGAEAEAGAVEAAFVVVEENVRVALNVATAGGYAVAQDDSILLRMQDGWYRATVEPFCANQMGETAEIGVGGGEILDGFSTLMIEGRRCFVRSLDRIAAPKTFIATRALS